MLIVLLYSFVVYPDCVNMECLLRNQINIVWSIYYIETRINAF